MRKSVGLAAALLWTGQAAQAQDARASPPLPSFPQVYETADLKIRVVKVADGLANPWSLAWLPNGDLLITERAGRLRDLAQRRARSRADRRRARSAHHAARRLARRAAASEFRDQPTPLSDLREGRRRQSRDDGADARAPRRQEARGREGDLRRRQLEQLADQLRRPHGVRPRRHAVPHRRRAPGARPRAEHDAARRQGAALARRRHGARPTIRSPASRAICRRSTPSAIAARKGSPCIP